MTDKQNKILSVNLFGSCFIQSAGDDRFSITGDKHRALVALLVTAPFGRRSRTFLQETLWGTANYDSGRQNLRRALSDIKRRIGPAFDGIFRSTNSDITIDLTKIEFLGRPGSGVFLDGLDIPMVQFQRWRNAIRDNPSQLYALYSLEAKLPETQIVPSIAILPFRAFGGSDVESVMGDWLAEEICRSLSRSNLLHVISHLSSRVLAKRVVDIGMVRAAFNVDYCVTGTLRHVDGNWVLDTDFVDVRSGKLLWTRQFRRDQATFFSTSAQGIGELISAIGRSIADEAIRHATQNRMDSLRDHQMLMASVSLMHKMTLAEFARSRELLEELLRRAPHAAEAHAWLAEWYVMSIFNGWSTDRERDQMLACDSISRALDIEPENAFCITIDGVVNNNLLHRLDLAEDRFDHALELNPNQAMSWLFKGVAHAYRDDAEEAVSCAEKARRLSPLDPLEYFFDSLSATAHLAAENYDMALELADNAIRLNSREISSLRVKISSLYHLGRKAEAVAIANHLLERQPGFRLDRYVAEHPAANFKVGRNMAEALEACGL